MNRLSPMRLALRTGVLLTALLFPVIAGADAPPTLRFDPFGSRPELELRQGGSLDVTPAFRPILMSTIVRGNRSLVNLGGKILALEEESEGYRLLEVRAFDALFLKDGQEIRLEVVSPEGAP